VIVALGSVRGSPGVTSWTMLLAAAWEQESVDRGRVVLEADPDGGVLAARYGVGVDPGAITFAASHRRGVGEWLEVAEHSRDLGSNVMLIPGTESADRASSMWRDAAPTTASAIAANSRFDWFVDCGRFRPESPSLAFTEVAALTILVVGPMIEDLLQLPATLRLLQPRNGKVVTMVVGKPAHRLQEIKDFLRSEHVFLAPSSRILPAETAAIISTNRARRGWLWRSALTLVAELKATMPEGALLHEVGAP
jgi:MinD-like ATPase involved in chromosome partitioning or flagellar assembly